jgi:hypothetical protein
MIFLARLVYLAMVELLLVCFAEAAKGRNKSSDEYL